MNAASRRQLARTRLAGENAALRQKLQAAQVKIDVLDDVIASLNREISSYELAEKQDRLEIEWWMEEFDRYRFQLISIARSKVQLKEPKS